MSPFVRFDLRTSDPEAARAFYARLLGHDRAIVWLLHEQAVARGARPHWLGQLAVEDAERSAAALVERGATPLGPVRPTDEGGRMGVLRGPGGAVMAVVDGPVTHPGAQPGVVWHVLNAADAARATRAYLDLFVWELTQRLEGGVPGGVQQFAWSPGGPSVGGIADIAGRPDVHPHWLFFFEVESLELGLENVRAGGGLALEPFVLPTGERACVCDDPQGAAFALRERAH